MASPELDLTVNRILDTFRGWGREATLDQMRTGWDDLFSNIADRQEADAQKVDANGVKSEMIAAPGVSRDRVVLYLHGGGYVLGSVNSHRDLINRLSLAADARVLALDYRLAPETPFPGAVEDSTAAYRWLLEQGIKPSRIAVAGDSAGGGLTAATLIALRDAGDPLPATGVMLSPWCDMEGVGETFDSKADVDPMVKRELILGMAASYLNGQSPKTPLANPLYADLTRLPPLLIQVGGRECLLDDAKRLAANAKTAGVDIEVDVWDEMIHVWQIFTSTLPEAQPAIDKLGAHIQKHCQ